MRIVLCLLIMLPCCIRSDGQPGTIKGRVTADGRPLGSATVSIGRYHLGAFTNSSGEYVIDQVPAGECEVTASYIGYRTRRITVNINSGIMILDIPMQPDESGLSELVVTGVTRKTTLRRNPVPIAVISRKEIVSSASNNIIDAIVKGIPGVSSVTTGPNISKPFIRGLGYNRVLTMYDGMRQEGQQWGDEHGIEIDQYGLERAEVVKGPASLIYGSDALAGVINMIPYFPTGAKGKVAGEALADYHSNNGMMGFSAAIGYKKHGWDYGLRSSWNMARNYRNKIDGWVYNTASRVYNLSAKADVERSWGYSHWGATIYDNLQEIPDGSRDSLSRKFTRQVHEAGEDDIRNRPVVSRKALISYVITPLHQHIQHYRIFTHNQLNLSRGSSLELTAGFQQSIRREYDHPSVPAQAGMYVVLNTISYEAKYNLPAWKGIEATIGMNGMYQVNRSKNATDFPIPDYQLFDAGGYIFGKKTLGRLDISGGLRYDTRHNQWDNFYVSTDPITGFSHRAGDTAGATLQFPSFDHDYKGISGSLGITYSISGKLLMKANISRGYRAPNITEIGSNGLDPGAHIVYQGNRNFRPEFSMQEDIGLLADLTDMDISISLFNNHIANYIYNGKLYDDNGQPVVIVPGNSTYRYEQAKAWLYGAEAVLNIHPTAIGWLSFNNNIAYVTGLNRNKALIKKEGDRAKYLPLIPPLHIHTELKGSFSKSVWMFSGIYIRVEADHYAAQNRFYGVDDTETATSGYTLFNAGCGATIVKAGGIKLFLQMDNIGNTAYQSNLSRLKYFEYYAASPNGHLGIYNMGRNMSCKVIVPFGAE